MVIPAHNLCVISLFSQLLHGDEWYSGACDRAEAEHALHLVNKVLYQLNPLS